jgi:hypothetical protein
MYEATLALAGCAFFALGAIARRWSALLVPSLLWLLLIGASALQGRIGDEDMGPLGFVLLAAIAWLVPALAITAVGVVLGRGLGRVRTRRRYEL